MAQESNPQTISHDVRWFLADEDGGIFLNTQKLPLETLLESDQFKDSSDLLRFVYDVTANAIHLQDARLWHGPISSGDEKAWKILNSALWFIRGKFGARPELRYGSPSGLVATRELHQFELAWNNIRDYIRGELGVEAKSIPVIEYAAKQDMPAMTFSNGVKIGDMDVNVPVFIVNTNADPYGDIDYEKVNQMLTQEYLNNINKLHADVWEPHASGERNLYFAIWQSGTRVFKASEAQRGRLIDEDSLREEPSLKGYRGPIVLFSYHHGSKRLVVHDTTPDSMSKSNFLKDMLKDVVRKIAKKSTVAESAITMSHDDVSSKPFLTKMSRQVILWDFIQEELSSGAGFEPEDIQIVESPLTKDGSINSMVIRNPDDERKLPLLMALRARHKVQASYPFIAVESRLASNGMKMHSILKEYAKIYQALQSLPLIQANFQDASNIDEFSFLHRDDEKERLISFMGYMLEMGMTQKSIIDFFAPRRRPVARAEFRKLLSEAWRETAANKAERRPATTKLASLDLGVNDWYHIGLQEALNQSQHSNDKPPTVEPFNLKRKKDQFSTGPLSMNGLLSKQHDRELSYMKSTEQLLRESQI